MTSGGQCTSALSSTSTTSAERSYNWTSRQFEIRPAETYYTVAAASNNSLEGVSWRYGTATVPHTAEVVIDTVTVLNDGDEGGGNPGDIEFFLLVDDTVVLHTPVQSILKCGDWDDFHPWVGDTITGSPDAVTVSVSALEHDQGICAIASGSADIGDPDGSHYVGGDNCQKAVALRTFNFGEDYACPNISLDFASPDAHLRIRVEGHIQMTIP